MIKINFVVFRLSEHAAMWSAYKRHCRRIQQLANAEKSHVDEARLWGKKENANVQISLALVELFVLSFVYREILEFKFSVTNFLLCFSFYIGFYELKTSFFFWIYRPRWIRSIIITTIFRKVEVFFEICYQIFSQLSSYRSFTGRQNGSSRPSRWANDSNLRRFRCSTSRF